MTEYADPAFPLPSPDFLFVFDLLVHSQGGSVSVGAARKWRWTATTQTHRGWIGAADPREIDRAAARGVVIDAVALFPHGVAVDEDDDLEAPTAPLTFGASAVPPVLVGRYAVTSVRPNPSHVRVLLTRFRGEDPAHAG